MKTIAQIGKLEHLSKVEALKYSIVVGFVALITFVAPLCHATGFSFQGQLERYQQNQSTPNRLFLFEGYSLPDKWIVKVYEGGQKRQFGHVEYGFEGTNHYKLEYVNQEPFHLAVTKPNFAFINGEVKKRDIPATSHTLLHVYWLAFRSAVYPDERPSELPWEFVYRAPAGNENARSIRTVYSYSKSNVTQLEEMLLLNPGVEYGMKNDYPLPAPYDSGFVLARFKILEWQDMGSHSLPIAFEWGVYHPKSGGVNSNDLEVSYLARGRVSNITPVNDVSVVPEVPEGAVIAVTDYRMQSESGAHGAAYISHSGFLKPNQPEYKNKLDQFRAAVAAGPDPIPRSRGVVAVIFVAFVMVTFFAVLLLGALRRKKASN